MFCGWENTTYLVKNSAFVVKKVEGAFITGRTFIRNNTVGS